MSSISASMFLPSISSRWSKSAKPDLLLLSCLYTVTMHAMEDTIISLRKAGLKGKVKTIVGGAPITQEFADQIGADGFGVDAVDGVKKAMGVDGTKESLSKSAVAGKKVCLKDW